MDSQLKISKIIFLALFAIGAAFPVLAADQDVGVTIHSGVDDIPIAVSTTDVTKLRIYKNGTVYYVQLVAVGDALATKAIVNVPGVGIRALKRYVPPAVVFNAANAPLYNPPNSETGYNPNFQCIDWTCTGSANGLFPVLIVNSTSFSAGNRLRINSASNPICPRVVQASATGWCKFCCCRNVPGQCNEYGSGSYLVYPSDARIKIGFYATNTAATTNLPLAEYTLSYCMSNDVVIPAGTNYIYVYFKENPGEYYDNNIAYKMTLTYQIKR